MVAPFSEGVMSTMYVSITDGGVRQKKAQVPSM
jgi:hypothetical protein